MQKMYHRKLDTQPENGWGSLIMIDLFPGEEYDPFITDEGMPLVSMMRSLITSIRGEECLRKTR